MCIVDMNEVRSREGTFKCLKCGKQHPWTEAMLSDTVQRGDHRYVGRSCYCIEKDSVAGKNDVSSHSSKKHGITVQLILNGTPKDTQSRAAMDSSIYGLEKARGPGKSIIWTSPVYHSMNGIKSMLRSFESFVTFGERIQTIRNNIGSDLKFNGEQFSIKDGVLEFSCKFQNSKQFFWNICLAAEISKTAEVWLPKGKPDIFTGKVEKILAKYERGRALCQRPERNSR